MKPYILMIVSVILAAVLIALVAWQNGDISKSRIEEITARLASVTGNAAANNDSDFSGKAVEEAQETNKPKVEAFVFSYCRFGLRFEKALAPVYNLLKDKADISVVYIGAWRGEYEKVESLRQLCVKKEYGNDKLWEYIEAFGTSVKIGACAGRESCLNPALSSLMSPLGIDRAKIDSCMARYGEALYQADGARAASLGISSSPTFVINSEKISLSFSWCENNETFGYCKNPEAIKQAVCSSFAEHSKPDECSQNLPIIRTKAGFG